MESEEAVLTSTILGSRTKEKSFHANEKGYKEAMRRKMLSINMNAFFVYLTFFLSLGIIVNIE